MAIKRKDGWYVVQTLLRESEFKDVFSPMREAEGLSESSFMRVRLGLPALKEVSKKGAKGTRRKSSSSRAGATPKAAAMPPAARAETGAAQGRGLPFIAHREEGAGGGEEFTELLDESAIPPRPEDGIRDGEQPDAELIGDADVEELLSGLDIFKPTTKTDV